MAGPAFADALAALLGDAGAPVGQAVGQRDTAGGNVLRRLAWLEMTARITETAIDGHGAAIGKLWRALDSALARVAVLERGAAGAPRRNVTRSPGG